MCGAIQGELGSAEQVLTVPAEPEREGAHNAAYELYLRLHAFDLVAGADEPDLRPAAAILRPDRPNEGADGRQLEGQLPDASGVLLPAAVGGLPVDPAKSEREGGRPAATAHFGPAPEAARAMGK